jgi:hypothetical protein
LTYPAVFELIEKQSKGIGLFLGKYTMFDNEKLLDLIMDILGAKIKMEEPDDAMILDKNWIEDMIERGHYSEKLKS